MKSSPSGRVPFTRELAFGMDVTLEATDRDLERVRELLREAGEGDGTAGAPESVDQALANAQRRIAMVRAALGRGEV